MATSATLPAISTPRWLRSTRFDLFFIVGVALIGTAGGVAVTAVPEAFVFVLLFDLWFLGYHHVISTYTRLCFDRESFRDQRWLLLALAPAVAIATGLVAWLIGIWAVFSVYFYWQWFHYTRQSWGISRAYRAKDGDGLYEDGALDQAIFYAVPVLGILYRSAQNPHTFLGLELAVLPVPSWAVSVGSVATAALLAYWVVRRIHAWRAGRLAGGHALYILSHFAIFGVGYIAIQDITFGWLAVNMWHNLQYILFVWLFNTRRFKGGVDPKARFLSYISQPQRLWLYLATCLVVALCVYGVLLRMVESLLFASLSATIVLYQVVNFHHYLVDSMIWKVRKTQIRETLGLPH